MAQSGQVQYAVVGDSYNTVPGMVDGGSWGVNTNVQTRSAINGVGAKVAGAALTVVTLNLRPVDTNCLLDKIIRSTSPHGLPSVVKLEAGDDEKGVKGASWYCHQAEIAMAAEAALSVNYTFHHSGKHTATTGVATPNYDSGGTTFEWYRGYVQADGSTFGCRSLKITVANNLIPVYDLSAKSTGSLRYPVALVAGPQQVTATAEYQAWPTHGNDLEGDELTTETIVAVAVNNASSPATYTFTLTDAKVISWSTAPVANNALKIYTVNYELDENDSSGLTIEAS